MIDWTVLFLYNRFDYDVQHFVGCGNEGYYKPRSDKRHHNIEDWIARRINKKLAGYEAMRKLGEDWKCPEVGFSIAEEFLKVAQQAEENYHD